jgi:polysaccharide biosynthesis protein PelD
MNNPTHIMGIRLSAIIETFVGLGILFAIDMLLGDIHFYAVNPHPYWAVVLLIAVQYGTAEGIFAAAIATAFFLLGGVPEAIEGADKFDYEYMVYINPVLWFLAGWGLGELRQRHVRERDILRKDLEDSQEREELISESYNFVKGRKEALEVQIAGQLSSSIAAYRAAKAAETLDPKSVMSGIENLISSVLGPQKFSIYLFHENKLSAAILHGWQAGETHAQTFDSYSPLYQAVVGSQQVLVIANQDHERLLDNQGVMAGPILDGDSKRVVGMFKIEQMDFAALSLSTVETFKALSEWIGAALMNARNYQTAKGDAMVNPERGLLSYGFFRRQSDYMGKLAKRVGFSLSMLVIKLNDANTMDDADRVTVARQLNESVKNVLRGVDLAFDYQTDGEEFSVLLPATGVQGANIVRDKIARELERGLSGKRNVNFTYIVQAIHEAA